MSIHKLLRIGEPELISIPVTEPQNLSIGTIVISFFCSTGLSIVHPGGLGRPQKTCWGQSQQQLISLVSSCRIIAL